ncbi:hypothetical protein MTO96_046092, partial [Rhipicephalus appendiculatus]
DASTVRSVRSLRISRLRAELRKRYEVLCKRHAAARPALERQDALVRHMARAAELCPDAAARFLMSDGATNNTSRPKPMPLEKRTCCYKHENVVCAKPALPYTRHCTKHIMYNVDQLLFEHCTAKFADNTQCCVPVFDMCHELPLCPEHAKKRDNYDKMAAEPKPKKPRKKSKPPALTRPPKRGKKKKTAAPGMTSPPPMAHSPSSSSFSSCVPLERLLASPVSQFGDATGTVRSSICNDSTTHRCEFPATPAADGSNWVPCCAHQDGAQVSGHAAPLAALFFHGSHDARLDEPPHAKVNSDNIPRFHGSSGSASRHGDNNPSNDCAPPRHCRWPSPPPTTASQLVSASAAGMLPVVTHPSTTAHLATGAPTVVRPAAANSSHMVAQATVAVPHSSTIALEQPAAAVVGALGASSMVESYGYVPVLAAASGINSETVAKELVERIEPDLATDLENQFSPGVIY